MTRRNVYWSDETNEKAAELAWQKRTSVSKMLAELVDKAAAAIGKTSKSVSPNE